MYTEEVVKKIESPLWKVLTRRGIFAVGSCCRYKEATAANQEQ
jgi:hypothetical protein